MNPEQIRQWQTLLEIAQPRVRQPNAQPAERLPIEDEGEVVADGLQLHAARFATVEQISDESRPELVDGSVCPECGHSEIDTRWANCPFPYGTGTDAVQLDVRLPVRKCRKCGFEFLDEEAEDLRHEAVCRHLGVLTPAEIKALRRKYGLKRKELAQLTGLGQATIARWERGALIQNLSNDTLLWLLQHEENVQRLRKRAERSTEGFVFQHPGTSKRRPKATDFALQAAS